MTNTDTGVLVLEDQEGNYYLLERELVERARVPAERRAEVERQLAGDDVAGFIIIVNSRPAAPLDLLGSLQVRGLIIPVRDPQTELGIIREGGTLG